MLASENVICTDCRHHIPLTNHHNIKNNEAILKFYGKLDVVYASALFYFQKKGIVQELIHKLKYKGHQEIGATIGYWYADELKNIKLLNDIDFIIPVPLHQKKIKKRGYNQVTAFANALSETLKIPVKELLLIRKKDTKSQTKKNRINRSAVLEHVFSVDETIEYQNKHFLLIDDVITTGATLESCGRELLKIQGARLSIVCIAMTKDH